MVVDLDKRSGTGARGKRNNGMGSHQRSEGETVEWYTPRGIFEALTLGLHRAVDAGALLEWAPTFRFDLDPCAPPGGLPWIPADRFYCEADDGLTQPWRGRVWLNPPYGSATSTWMRRAAAHGNGLCLVFARTETEWWHETVPSASAVCFIRGRLTFVDRNQQPGHYNAGAPSALVAYGDPCAQVLAHTGLGQTFGVKSRPLAGQGSLWE